MHLYSSGVPLLHVMDARHDGSSLVVSLKGPIQRLGLPGPHSTHRRLLDRLAENSPEMQDLTIRLVNPSYVLAAMRSNKIDSFFCVGAMGHQMHP